MSWPWNSDAAVSEDLVLPMMLVMMTMIALMCIVVVLDRKTDKTCDTGLFELIYRQQPITEPPQLDSNLCVEGRKVKCSSTMLP